MSQAVKEFMAFCNDHKDPFNKMLAEIDAERSRDHHIAAAAAAQISEGIPLSEIEQEELQALHEWIGQELLDRDVVAAESNQLPFWDKP